MKNLVSILLVLVFIFAFSSCGKIDENSNENTSNKQNNSNISNDSSKGEQNSFDAYPILFLDLNNYKDKAFILCSVEKNNICQVDKYLYNDKAISHYLTGEEVLVESPIIDTTKRLTFYDSKGNSFETDTLELYCSSKDRVIEGAPAIIVKLSKEINSKESLLIGTYSGIDIFDVNTILNDNSIATDLDSDGKQDYVSWDFMGCKNTEFREYFDYTISVNNGKTVGIIENDTTLPVKKQDLWITVSDINVDGFKEIFVYDKALSRFGTISIYQIKDNELTRSVDFVINPMP